VSQPVTTCHNLSVEERRKRNRERMPETARVIDELQRVFGKVTVLHAKEGGHEIGAPGPRGVIASGSGRQFVRRQVR